VSEPEPTQIKTLEDIYQASLEKRSLTCPSSPWVRPVAAAVVFSMQCNTVLNYIRRGLFIYNPKPSKRVFPLKRKEEA